jgi:hypothetical protein
MLGKMAAALWPPISESCTVRDETKKKKERKKRELIKCLWRVSENREAAYNGTSL